MSKPEAVSKGETSGSTNGNRLGNNRKPPCIKAQHRIIRTGICRGRPGPTTPRTTK
jgi:hypothetical protein